MCPGAHCGGQKSTPGSECPHLSHPFFVAYLSFWDRHSLNLAITDWLVGMASEPLRSFCVLPLQRFQAPLPTPGFYIGFKVRTLCWNTSSSPTERLSCPHGHVLFPFFFTENIDFYFEYSFCWILCCINIVLYRVGVSESEQLEILLPWYVVFFLSALEALSWTQLYPTRTWLGLSFTRRLSTVRPEGTASRWRHP